MNRYRIVRQRKLGMLTGRGPAQRLGDAIEVHNNGFDAIAFALNLCLEALHFVTIEGISDILWPGQPPSGPRTVVNGSMNNRALPDGY